MATINCRIQVQHSLLVPVLSDPTNTWNKVNEEQHAEDIHTVCIAKSTTTLFSGMPLASIVTTTSSGFW